MIERAAFVFLIFAAPGVAQVAAPGGDASSVLGRDAVPPAVPQPRPTFPTPTITVPEAASVALSDGAEIQIGAVYVTGLSQLSQADFADIAENFAGRTVDKDGLRQLARAIADRARDRGYIFASAAIPPQQLKVGIVRVALDEGAVDEVRISGSSNPRLIELLNELVGPAPLRDHVERHLLLAGDIPAIEIKSTRYVREGSKRILLVKADETRTFGKLRLDNYGSRSFGPIRARLETGLNSLFDGDDQLATYTTLTPTQPRELTYVAARYSNIVSASGLELVVFGSAGRTHDMDRAKNYVSVGRSRSASAALSTPLVRASAASFWLSGEIAYTEVDQEYLTFDPQRDDIASATITAWGNVRIGKSRLRGGVSITRGLDILGATEEGDPKASRVDASGIFTKANAWVSWTGEIVDDLSLRLAANGQLASRPLLSPQEIGLGGPNYARGYDFSERFGDQGALGSAEVRRTFDKPARWLGWVQLYGFVDGGYIDNLRGGFGGGTLISGGGGLRAASGRAEVGVELAAPINADRFESRDRSPKVNVAISYGF